MFTAALMEFFLILFFQVFFDLEISVPGTCIIVINDYYDSPPSPPLFSAAAASSARSRILSTSPA
jgi:hypothetical protein